MEIQTSINKNEDSLLLKIIRFFAYYQHSILRRVPDFITNKFPPLVMSKVHLRRSRHNPYKIETTLTNQSVCAKHCGSCPSNPFTHGGLYCTSGKSTKKVEERGCHCFECPLFEKCGGLGYFCKFGSAEQMERNPSLGEELNRSSAPILPSSKRATKARMLQAKTMIDTIDQTTLQTEDRYHRRFIHSLIQKKETLLLKKQAPIEDIKKRSITIEYEDLNRKVVAPYGKSLLEISTLNQINHTHVCGGRAKCSTCRVLILSGSENLSKRNKAEELIALQKQFPPRVRLACQTIPMGDVKIRRLVQNRKTTHEAIRETKDTSKFFGIDSHAAVLFADIRSFTTFSETNLPYDVVQILNEYFATISKPIDAHGGYVDKYMGDGIMAIFGLTGNISSPEKASVDAALEMLAALADFNQNLLKKYQHQFKIGIGIDAGEVVMAKLGFAKKSQFTAIGDVVNTSARIEGATKEQGVSALVSHNVYKVVKNDYTWGKSFSSKLKGKVAVTSYYEPTGWNR